KMHALTHFEAGLKASPADVRLLSLYGETLLRAGRYKEAVVPLAQAIDLAPELEQTRALYARALRYTLRYDDAADQLMKLVEKTPDKLLWQRAAIGALSQAGRKQEAEALFGKYVANRSTRLPQTFQEAMGQLEERLDTAPIPQARLDWAWSLRGDVHADRAQWERRARWGHLVDHLLFDWLECREERVEEAMQLLGELDTGERFFAPLLAAGRGVVVATAHVGPMYAGLMALELLGIPSRWLATAPRIAQSSYAAALISTADQTEAQVAKACMRALGSGNVLCLAIDGAANPAAPRAIFEGQEVTYSSFASHLAHRLGVPSVFYAPRWENGRVAYTLEMLPAVNPGEDADAYSQRWQKAYFERLREHVAGPPENLRLSGGIWRHVTSADRSA
ncbi:MAG: Vi polysaccharide transport protein VexE, partial [Achromobacter pestifer]